MKLTENTTLIEWFRTKNMWVHAKPHEYGWMGHVMYIDSREYAHWTHPPVDSYEDAMEQAIEHALTNI